MENEFYTVEQIAEMLGLHPKTIRRFIREGKIMARKIGKQWRISGDDLKDFTGAGDGNIIEKDGSFIPKGSADDIGEQNKPKIQISTVVDVFVEDAEEAVRITNTVFAIMNCKDPSYGRSRCDHIFYKNEMKARFIFWGGPEFIINVVGCISAIARKEDEL